MLTVVEIRALKPRDRPFKVSDGDGLYLLVQPSGALRIIVARIGRSAFAWPNGGRIILISFGSRAR
jgi:hypothetical protein